MLRFAIYSVIFFYLVSALFPILKLDGLLSSLCFIIVASSFFRVKRFVQVLGSIFLVLGIGLLWNSGSHWSQYILSFGPMLDLLTMFTLIPILGIPIKLGEYGKSIQAIINKNITNSGHLYMFTSGISYFFSIFMNLGTLPMTYYSVRPALDAFPKIAEKDRFMSRAISRGFAMPLLWAPVTPIVGIVITMTGVSWVSILPYVIPLSIMGMFFDWFIATRKSKNMINKPDPAVANEIAATVESVESERRGNVYQILLAILLFTITISILDKVLSYPFLITVSLLIIPFALLWSLFLKKGKEFGCQLQNHLQSFYITMKDQFFIFLATGFFISAIHTSNANEMVNGWTLYFIDAVGIQFFIIILPLIPLFLAFLGLHPAVSLVLMVEGINLGTLGISPILLTVAMLAGAVSAFLVGPYNATIGLMSNLIKTSSYKVSNWNLPFAIVYIACVTVYLCILEIFLV